MSAERFERLFKEILNCSLTEDSKMVLIHIISEIRRKTPD